ncbi:MAG: hypothetical protein HOE90_24470 [Bacteriovoracaceae bacterium]|jgi:general secretion pathway protein D|nr:hypothetical protein [Bacteriovoracaceae bacterium]
MKKIGPLVITILVLVPALSFAGVCKTIKECVGSVSELTGHEYMSSEELKGDIFTSANLKLDKSNANRFLSDILSTHGYSVIPMGQNKWNIISSRNIRYHASPIIKVKANQEPKIPDNSNYHQLIYVAKHPMVASEIQAVMRPLMSRYGRSAVQKNSSKILFLDTARNLKKIYQIAREFDYRPTKTQVRRWHSSRSHRRVIQKNNQIKEKAEKSKS